MVGCDIGQEVPPLGQCEDGEGAVGVEGEGVGQGDITAQSLASHGSAVTLEREHACRVLRDKNALFTFVSCSKAAIINIFSSLVDHTTTCKC